MRFITTILILAFVAGVFDSCMDARRDLHDQAVFAKIQTEWFHNWYEGGNDRYSIPIWGPYDFWHFSKSCLMACWVLIAVFSFYAGSRYLLTARWWHIVLAALSVYWLQGFTFWVFYHHIWPL